MLLSCLSITAEGVSYKVFFFFQMALTRVIVKNSVHRRMSRTETPKAAQMPIIAALLREALLAEVDEAVVTVEGVSEEGVDKVVESDGGKEPEKGTDKVVGSDGDEEELVGVDEVVEREPTGHYTTHSLEDNLK